MRQWTILGLAVVLGAVVWQASRVEWKTLGLRQAYAATTTQNWDRLHLQDGRTLLLDLHDDEILENVDPQPFADGKLGSVARWRQPSAELGASVTWPAWLQPCEGSTQTGREAAKTMVPISAKQRQGSISRSYRFAIPFERVAGYYQHTAQARGLVVLNQSRSDTRLTGFEAQSTDRQQRVVVNCETGLCNVMYILSEAGSYQPPSHPGLDLEPVSVHEAEQYVQLRNRVDGEMLRLPFSALADEHDFTRVRAAGKRPEFLPPYPGSHDAIAPEEQRHMLNLAFRVSTTPETVVAFYRALAMKAGFKIDQDDAGVTRTNRTTSGFYASDKGKINLLMNCLDTDGESFCQAMYFH